jgi:hypothetical protein
MKENVMGELLRLDDGGGPEPFVQDREKTVLENVRDELSHYYQEMKKFNEMESEDVFRSLSAYSARASEVRGFLNQLDSRRSQALRTREIEPFIDECDRQFRVHSRIVAIRESDIRLAGGRFT